MYSPEFIARLPNLNCVSLSLLGLRGTTPVDSATLNHALRLGSGHAPLGQVPRWRRHAPERASGAWWTWRELNPRPPARQAGALPLSYRPGLRLAPLTQAALSGVERAALSSQHA